MSDLFVSNASIDGQTSKTFRASKVSSYYVSEDSGTTNNLENVNQMMETIGWKKEIKKRKAKDSEQLITGFVHWG